MTNEELQRAPRKHVTRSPVKRAMGDEHSSFPRTHESAKHYKRMQHTRLYDEYTPL